MVHGSWCCLRWTRLIYCTRSWKNGEITDLAKLMLPNMASPAATSKIRALPAGEEEHRRKEKESWRRRRGCTGGMRRRIRETRGRAGGWGGGRGERQRNRRDNRRGCVEGNPARKKELCSGRRDYFRRRLGRRREREREKDGGVGSI